MIFGVLDFFWSRNDPKIKYYWMNKIWKISLRVYRLFTHNNRPRNSGVMEFVIFRKFLLFFFLQTKYEIVQQPPQQLLLRYFVFYMEKEKNEIISYLRHFSDDYYFVWTTDGRMRSLFLSLYPFMPISDYFLNFFTVSFSITTKSNLRKTQFREEFFGLRHPKSQPIAKLKKEI